MSSPKFKIGDRVKWRRTDGPDSSGEVVSVKVDAAYGYQYKLTDGGGLWWHESHLSQDVPEPKKYAADLEVQLGIEIINLKKTYKVQVESIAHLTKRLTEEIGGRHRERIIKERAQKALAALISGVERLHELAIEAAP